MGAGSGKSKGTKGKRVSGGKTKRIKQKSDVKRSKSTDSGGSGDQEPLHAVRGGDISRPRRKRGRRTRAQIAEDKRKIGKLYFIQCWTAAEIAAALGLSVSAVEKCVGELREEFGALDRKGMHRSILAEINERGHERIKKLWNEYVELTRKTEELEGEGKMQAALYTRSLRMRVIGMLNKLDDSIIQRLKRMGLLKEIEGYLGNDEEDSDEVQKRFKGRYGDSGYLDGNSGGSGGGGEG